jgi:hypothetical protein
VRLPSGSTGWTEIRDGDATRWLRNVVVDMTAPPDSTLPVAAFTAAQIACTRAAHHGVASPDLVDLVGLVENATAEITHRSNCAEYRRVH